MVQVYMRAGAVAGGLGALAVAGVWAAMFTGLRRPDELGSEALRPQGEQMRSAGGW
jgi:hypothetical protein